MPNNKGGIGMFSVDFQMWSNVRQSTANDAHSSSRFGDVRAGAPSEGWQGVNRHPYFFPCLMCKHAAPMAYTALRYNR